jgi:hypothetical protein
MPAPRVAVQGSKVGDDSSAERIEVKVADEFEKVWVLLHHDGLVPVLKEVTGPTMAAVEGPGISREERAHASGQGT